ncbi:MAG: hypothetical protein ACRDNZ_23735 [Streptosporangiaceae bacterium]
MTTTQMYTSTTSATASAAAAVQRGETLDAGGFAQYADDED